MAKALNIVRPAVANQRFSCASCTRCCRELVVHLFPDDIKRIDRRDWSTEIGVAPYVRLNNTVVLNKRSDNACVFLNADGKCRIHAKYGFDEKPLACRLFPWTLRRLTDAWHAGLRFDCPTVCRSQGDKLDVYQDDLARIASVVKSSLPTADDHIDLQPGVAASDDEVLHLIGAIDRCFASAQTKSATIDQCIRQAAYVTTMVARANLTKVRNERFAELVDILFAAAPGELSARQAQTATVRQRNLLRQLAYAYTQSATLAQMQATLGRKAQHIWRQLRDARAFRKARGRVPAAYTSDRRVTFGQVEAVQPASGDDADRVADLLARYVRSRLQLGTVSGEGYYGWPLVEGLVALWLSVVVISWHARLAAASAGRTRMTFDDVVSATVLVDRTAARVPAHGTKTERLRARYLSADEGLQSLLDAYPITTP